MKHPRSCVILRDGDLLLSVEERLDSRSKRRRNRCRHFRRRQLPAHCERALQRFAGAAAAAALGEVRLHRRAEARIDATFEML